MAYCPRLTFCLGSLAKDHRMSKYILPTFALWVLVVVLAAGALTVSGCGDARPSGDGQLWEAPPGTPTVALTIDFGDGVEKRFLRLPWREKLTVLDILRAAAAHPHGIRYEARGSGESAFVTSIDGTANQQGEEEAKNWIYRVNGDLATKSADSYPVQAGDVIVWKFEQYE